MTTYTNREAWSALKGIQSSTRNLVSRGMVPLHPEMQSSDPCEDLIRGPSTWLAKEGVGVKAHTSMLWVIASRIIVEEFYPSQGSDGTGWFRRVADVDWWGGDVYISSESERGGFEKRFNAGDPDLDMHDTVYIGQTEEALAEIIVGTWELPPNGKVEELTFE